MNEHGVLGQVTRAYLLSSEVTLLADRDATIPVLNARTQHAAPPPSAPVTRARWSCASWPPTPT
jgi:hypothetical protein